MTARPHRTAAFGFALVAAVAVLAGCGRRGDLEPPPGVSLPAPEPAPTVFGTSAPAPAPTPTPAPDRPFLLDFLI